MERDTEMKIIIKGVCAEGKTTIALLIKRALLDAGITQVDNRDYDCQVVTMPASLQAQRVKALASRSDFTIHIETVQTKKKKR